MSSDKRWIELAINPTENLDTELKAWLDLTAGDDKANLAHGILALANHGGGAILVGYEAADGGWRECVSAPTALASFTTDSVNGIVEKFSDPSFHCELHVVRHEKLVHAHPVIVVPGGHRVPIRARCSGPNEKHVRKDTYYVRRPGPQSAPPQSATEWQQLIHRCIMADRDALLDNLRAAIAGEPSRSPDESQGERAAGWESACMSRFREILAEKRAFNTYRHGYYSFAYIFGDRLDVDKSALLQELNLVERQTGWPAWIVFGREPIAPYPFDDLIECHVFEPSEPPDPAHADFWRAAPDGRFFLLRGYQEDGHEDFKGKFEPGTVLDRSLPFWRIGECLLHATRMADRLGVPSTSVEIRVMWTGLDGRHLDDVADRNILRGRRASAPSKQPEVRSRMTVDADRIRLQLTDLVSHLTKPLYEVFGFEVARRSDVEDALQKMLNRTGGA